jgi:glutamate N-acetyltransferase/amino-acid N-acetyltransferase
MKVPQVRGFSFAGLACGIKKSGKPDLALIVADDHAACAGVFTQNQIVAAPVVLSRDYLRQEGKARAVIINSGNANACTGARGDKDALTMTQRVADRVGCAARDVQVCSTGVIGAPLPMETVEAGIDAAFEVLGEGTMEDFGDAICTTDTRRKVRGTELEIGGRVVRIAGCSKGAGMIHPNMATMLGVVVTDAPVATEDLDRLWRGVCDRSFNAITIDGDTSTNDTALLLASGAAGGEPLSGPDLNALEVAIEEVAGELARDIVRDGEGATKLVRITIAGAATDADVRVAANAVALSPLVKTAIHGEDPNWGRIIAAAGRSGAKVVPSAMKLWIGTVPIYMDGVWQGTGAESEAHDVMLTSDYPIRLDLGTGGTHIRTIFTCDFSADYVRINADYRS